jgi:hypothetical protein
MLVSYRDNEWDNEVIVSYRDNERIGTTCLSKLCISLPPSSLLNREIFHRETRLHGSPGLYKTILVFTRVPEKSRHWKA